ncbi:MAG TPA: hypothetical protein VL961_01120 [Acidimicrobiales bacterium]|nr:hypothetical protein [Acidimicrobiales bacterium]
MRALTRAGIGLVALAASLGAWSGARSPAGASPLLTVTTGNCAWEVHADPALLNVAYPDSGATYYALLLPGLPGETVTIAGQFPHARYMSFTTYDDTTQPVDEVDDQSIVADQGSSNPFLPGADRTSAQRAYHVTVVFGRPPADPPANALYTTNAGGTRAASAIVVLYRVYVPDEGVDALGGVPLPRVTVNLAGWSVNLPDCPSASAPAAGEVNTTVADLAPPPVPVPTAATSPPVWHKVVGGAIQYFANPDNEYLSLLVGDRYGRVVVIRGELPTYPATETGAAVMTTGQLRYWSLCSNEQLSTRYWGCLADYQMVTNAERQYTVVVSAPAARPPNAVPSCGINWLPWGPSPDSLLLMRNMLASPSFTESVQAAQVGQERQDMGPYYPSVEYSSSAAVAQLGCHPPA